jgi:hypothetical protein
VEEKHRYVMAICNFAFDGCAIGGKTISCKKLLFFVDDQKKTFSLFHSFPTA